MNLMKKSCPESTEEDYKYHDQIRELKMNSESDVEQVTFNPLNFCTGGAGASVSKLVESVIGKLGEIKRTPTVTYT